MKMKAILYNGILPIVGCFLIMGLSIIPSRLIKSLNTKLVTEITLVAGEETYPVMGRIYFIIYAVIMLVILGFLIHYFYIKSSEASIVQFLLSFLVGVILWQILGETMWHFAFETEDGLSNFVRLESIQGLPIFVLFTVFWVDAFLRRRYNHNILFVLGAFWTMWFGHVLVIGTNPFFPMFSEDEWFPIAALIFSIPAVLIGGYGIVAKGIGKKVFDKQSRLISALILFAGIGCLFYVFVLKER